MQIIPAIDISFGACVRLYQGDFDKRTEYSTDPAAVARRYEAMGLTELHVVDLDGAHSGQQQNSEIVSAIANETKLSIQLGGGIRHSETISAWLEKGVSRCVIGSRAITDPALVREWCTEFGADRITLALDVRFVNNVPHLATHGWTATSEQTLWQCLDDFQSIGLRHVLCTDVSRDGTMTGPNLDLYGEFVVRFPAIKLQASGGVRNVTDIGLLDQVGAYAAITGRALLDGKISDQEIQQFLPAA